MPTITDRIAAYNKERDPEKVKLKYKAMLESSFRFLRGGCHLYYEDVANGFKIPDSPCTWLCGDLHLENFGSFRGGDGEVYFDINDFDEALLGPALYDVSRLLVSIQLACTTAGYKKEYINKLLLTLIDGYKKILLTGKPITVEDVTAKGLVKELLDDAAFSKPKKLVKEKTDSKSDNKKIIIDNEKTFSIDAVLKKELKQQIQAWLNEIKGQGNRKVHDLAYLIAGTGSIGVNRYMVLVSDTTNNKKYLLVIKQACPSSLAPYITLPQPVWADEAQRINEIQYRMQHVTPGGLNSFTYQNKWYITKWVQPEADKINLEAFLKASKEQESLIYTLGTVVAAAQLRSGGRNGSAIADDLIAFATNDAWVTPLLQFTEQYAQKTEKDYLEYKHSFSNLQ